MRWPPLDSPYAKASKAIFRLVFELRARFILLHSAWWMKPDAFRPDSKSSYKNLGWGSPLIPETVYAYAANAMLAARIEQDVPALSGYFFPAATIMMACLIYFFASVDFGFHLLMCGLGRIFKMRESPPPYWIESYGELGDAGAVCRRFGISRPNCASGSGVTRRRASQG